MTPEELTGLILALLVMSLGILGSLLPALPSTPIVLLAAVGHRIYFGEESAGWFALSLLTGLTLLSLLLDYLASLYGARKMGATSRGMWGAVAGTVIGLFFSLPGILLGPFLGATLFELSGGREWKEASRAGLGATIGLIAGAAGKAATCVVMMVIFTLSVLYHSLN